MERNDSNAYEYIKFLNNTEIKSKAIDNGDGNTVEVSGRQSLFNRYALFSFRGKDSVDASGIERVNDVNSERDNTQYDGVSPELSSALQAALAQPQAINIQQNPSVSSIVSYYLQNQSNAMEYDYLDFLYCKHHGRISNNYCITLRRFPFSVEDNIFNKNVVPNPDIARVVSYFGDGTENSINNIIGFSTGFNWKEVQSEIQVLSSQRIGNPFSGKLGALTDGLARGENPNAAIAKDSRRLRTGQDFNDPTELSGFYHNKILGPVNVIDKMNIRDRGLNYEQNISFVAEYSLKSYGGVNPKEAMLDILTNLLTIGYNNAPFWGGAIRYMTDNRTSHLLGDQNLLLNGDYLGYLKSVGGDLSNTFSNVFGGGTGEFSFSNIIGGLLDMGKGLLSKFVTNKLSDSGAVPNYQVANALLSGEATGEWHLTIGNPLNPTAVMGNLCLESMNISFEETLGTDDFPVGIKAEFTLKPARPRDKTDIENMFNLGQGRTYFVPADRGDILNLQGGETYNYGVVNGAKNPSNEADTSHKRALTLKTEVGQETSLLQDRFRNWGQQNINNALKFHSVNENLVSKT